MTQIHWKLKAKTPDWRMCIRRFMCGAIAFGLLNTGCTPGMPSTPMAASSDIIQFHTASPESTITIAPGVTETVPAQEIQETISLTTPNLDGNRLLDGAGFTPDEPLEIQLLGKPIWVVAAAFQDQSAWYVVLDNGLVQVFRIEGRLVIEEQSSISFLPPGMPPALALGEGQLALIPPAADAANFTNPLLLEDDTMVYVGRDGELHFSSNGEEGVLPVDALPDARILSDGTGRLMILSNPSDIYPHGIMGDELEATGITIINTSVVPFAVREIRIASGEVIEGLAPIWVDMDGDGGREIIVTQSNVIDGSKIVVYREDGSVLAQGRPIGQGFRWIHQVAVGQFIEGGSLEIATVRTPHIGGVVEIYSLEGDQLSVAASLAGYSSHRISSRNLDSGLAGDFNGDGLIELVVPDQAQIFLHGIQYTEGQLISVWNVPLGGRLSTNLAGLELSDGRLAFGAGTADHLLRIWIP